MDKGCPRDSSKGQIVFQVQPTKKLKREKTISKVCDGAAEPPVTASSSLESEPVYILHCDD